MQHFCEHKASCFLPAVILVGWLVRRLAGPSCERTTGYKLRKDGEESVLYWTGQCPKAACCSSVTQLCPTRCDPRHCSMPGFTVLHYLPEFAQTHVHWVDDAIQPSHPLSSPSPRKSVSMKAFLRREAQEKGRAPEQLQHCFRTSASQLCAHPLQLPTQTCFID